MVVGMNSVEQFRDAIRAAGMTPPDHIEPGRFHRFAGVGKRNGNTSGWCKLFADERGGVFGDYACDFADHWQVAHEGPAPTPTERAAFRQRIEGARAEAEAARRAEHAEVATRAAATWQAAQPAPADHGYLARKGILPNGARITDDGRIVLPVRVAGEITSLQFIDADGGKRFLPGGRVAGGYYAIGNPDGAAALCIVEGCATGATVHEATDLPVAIAFSAGNLGAVAQAMRQRFPGLPLVVCGDDDYRTEGNPGATKARAAAAAVGAGVALPDFGDDRPACGTDYNDLARVRGLDVVRAQVVAAIPGSQGDDEADPRADVPGDPGRDVPEPQNLFDARTPSALDVHAALPAALAEFADARARAAGHDATAYAYAVVAAASSVVVGGGVKPARIGRPETGVRGGWRGDFSPNCWT
jgi:putative DNA primase/helicase